MGSWAREQKKRLIRWRYLGDLPLRITYIYTEIACRLLGHKWVGHHGVDGTPAAYCDRCFRVID